MLNQLQGVFASLQENNVKYLVIEGIASVLYGVPRATFDLDILIESSKVNAENLLLALEKAGLGTAQMVSAEKILANEITVFKDFVRIDVQTSSPGIQFEEVWPRRETMEFQGQELQVLSKDDLIASKRAAGRDVDLEDVRLLELDDSN